MRKWISLFCIPFRRSLGQIQQLRFMLCAMVYVHFGYSNQLPKGSTNAIAVHIFGWFWMGPCNRAWSVFGQALFHDFLEKAISQVPKRSWAGRCRQCKAIVSHHFSPRHAFFSQSVFAYLLPKNWKLLCIKPRLNMSAGLQMQVVNFFLGGIHGWPHDLLMEPTHVPQMFQSCSFQVIRY